MYKRQHYNIIILRCEIQDQIFDLNKEFLESKKNDDKSRLEFFIKCYSEIILNSFLFVDVTYENAAFLSANQWFDENLFDEIRLLKLEAQLID